MKNLVEVKIDEKNLSSSSETFIDISKISSELKQYGLAYVDEVSKITIPLRFPVNCDLMYNAIRPVSGNRVQVSINGKLIDELSYNNDNGKKDCTCDITEYLHYGINELRFRCLITSDNFSENSDFAKLVIRSEGNTIIRKEYTTRCSIEPIDQIWMLRVINEDNS